MAKLSYPSFVETKAERSAYDVARIGGWDEWVYNKSDLLAIQQGCYFDIKKALRPKRFIEQFCYLSPGKPFILFDWQWRRVVAPLFGWINKDGKRRFKRSFITVAKKNGKSALCAALMIYLLVGTGEYSANVFNIACTREQAGELYSEVIKMIRNSPVLRSKLEIKETVKRVLFRKMASKIHTLAAAVGGSQGMNASALIVDELHEWTTKKGRDLWDSLKYAGSSREEPIAIVITTAGGNRFTVCYEQYLYAKKVAAGLWDDTTYHSAVFEADETDDIQDPATWRKANPSWGMGQLTDDDFRLEAQAAKVSISAETAFRRYTLNQWVQANEKAGWIRHAAWKACKPQLPVEEYAGMPCVAALDIGSVSDLTALVVAYPHEDGAVSIFPYFWVPEETAFDREKKQEAPYQTWIDRGLVIGTEGSATDYDKVRADINTLREKHGFETLAVDVLFQGAQLAMQLMSDGLDVHPHAQGVLALTNPSKRFEHLVRNKNLAHGNNDVLDWMLSNVTLYVDGANNYKPDKKRSKDKIDGIIATIMAISLLDLKGFLIEREMPQVYVF